MQVQSLDVTRTGALVSNWIDTPLGRMLAVACDEGVIHLDFVDDDDAARVMKKLGRRDGEPGSVSQLTVGFHPHLSQLADELAEYFSAGRTEFSVPLASQGSDFEQRVWNYLRTIPYGQTRSYGQQARAIGMPQASRAVGHANGMNRVAILIPCHRVIGSDGKLTGYAGGLERKRWLLELEGRGSGGTLFATSMV
jgi:AraC family transcriptional regulator of adaptative response/methylated-DNA-[protein]-cysteine methyltransferase